MSPQGGTWGTINFEFAPATSEKTSYKLRYAVLPDEISDLSHVLPVPRDIAVVGIAKRLCSTKSPNKAAYLSDLFADLCIQLAGVGEIVKRRM